MDEVTLVEEVGGDLLLRLLARAAQENDLKMTLTLNVHGGTVAGLLVGKDKWIEEVATTVEPHGPGGKSLADVLKDLNRELDLQKSEDQPTIYSYIHLRDARFLSGPLIVPTAPSPGMLWRGRISEVAAWGLGSLATHAV